jgi:hypothetical protein
LELVVDGLVGDGWLGGGVDPLLLRMEAIQFSIDTAF